MKRVPICVLVSCLGFCSQASGQGGIITTVAGNGTPGYSGDVGPATSASLNYPTGVAVDASQNIFIADRPNERIRKVSASGIITTVAGNGTAGFSGDGGPATSASLGYPVSVAVDTSGNLFIADQINNRIRKVSAAGGIITTVAGNGTTGFSGDGGPATSAFLDSPYGVAVDASGNLFIADYGNNRIRKVSASGIITTVAGNGTTGFSGDGGPAASASFSSPADVAVDSFGNLFIVDLGNNRIREVSASGIITTVAGAGTKGFSGDGGPATSASLNSPFGVAVDASGDLFIGDTLNSRIRKVSTSGIITTVAGNGTQGFSGEGGLATSASLSSPWGVAVDASGNLFIADFQNQRIREVSALASTTETPASQTITFGSLSNVTFGVAPFTITATASSGLAVTFASTTSSVCTVSGSTVTIVAVGTCSITASQAGNANYAVATPVTQSFTVDSATGASGQGGIIKTVAGSGDVGFSGDGEPATAASLWAPMGVAVDASGNLFVADSTNQRIRKVSAGGIITTVAGSGAVGPFGSGGFSGDGGPATSAELGYPTGVAVDAAGNLFIADAGNHRIRKVSASGIITTVAGNGINNGLCSSGDGGLATSAQLCSPQGVAVDASGNLFIADFSGQRIRKVSASGIITTVAGNGTQGFAGDAGPATSAELDYPTGVAVDASGNLFIADSYTNRIREVSATGIITTVAGSGPGCSGNPCGSFAGDGGPATAASLYYPTSVAVDSSGNLFIADTYNNRIRQVSGGIITTVAGSGAGLPFGGFSGDGGPATAASLFSPSGVAVDSSGNLFIADTLNYRIREVSAPVSSVSSVTVSPANLSFSLFAGGSSSQQISLASAAGVAWSASASSNWITLSPISGTEPSAITVAVNTASLQPGAYMASITISNPSALPTQEIVSVNLTVAAATASLSVTPAALDFQIQQGAAAQSQSLQIGGAAGTAWQATATTSTGGAWLSVSPGSGQIPASLTALVNSGALPAGTYQGSITVQAPGAPPPSSTVGVTLTVTAAGGQGGIITTVAGNGESGFSGDGGAATSASLNVPWGVAVDASGNLFIVDQGNSRIRKVTASGIITTVAGNGKSGFSGDGGPATSATFRLPDGVAVDTSGNLFIADSINAVVRKVSTSGIITTFAGGGSPMAIKTGLPATSAALTYTTGVAVDAFGNLSIAESDSNGSQVWKVSASGIITAVVGNGSNGFAGDGGLAASAELNFPQGMAVDAAGNLFIADTHNNRIRKVSAGGIITTAAGNGNQGFSNDGGPATSAGMGPWGVAADASGNLFIADENNNRIRKVSANGIITTVAGNGTQGFSGDGGPATSASLDGPSGIAVDAAGNLFITDNGNNRIRKVSASASTIAPSISAANVASFTTPISPGSLVALFGNGNILANSTASGFNTPLPTSSGGTSVTMNGLACPLLYVSPAQINLQAPTALSAGTATVVVNNNGQNFSTTVQVLAAAPGIFTSDYVITAILQDGNGALLDQSNPASPGQSVAMYLTGIGPVTNYPGDGEPAPFGPLAQSTSSYTLTVNGTAAHIDYLGLTPGLVSVGQINFEIPAGTPSGNTIPVVLTIAGTVSKTVQISVK